MSTDGRSIHILIIEGKEEVGQGGGSPQMQLAAYYANMAVSLQDTDAMKQTCLPALGLEFFGNCFR